jgi:Domain of unknown function (DUF4387)
MKLGELSSLVRSKNAGPFVLTFDVLFDDQETYERVKESGKLSREMMSEVYKCPLDQVRLFHCDNMKAIKLSIPRPIFQGDLKDADMLGGQQFAPLLDIEIPD